MQKAKPTFNIFGFKIPRPVRFLQILAIIFLLVIIFRTMGNLVFSNSNNKNDDLSPEEADNFLRRLHKHRKSSNNNHREDDTNDHNNKNKAAIQIDPDILLREQKKQKEDLELASSENRKFMNNNAKHVRSPLSSRFLQDDGEPPTVEQVQNLQKFLLFAELRRAGSHFRLQRGGQPRACFAVLVRHTKDGLERFTRLMRNVKEQLPLMSKRYPFVGFLESSADIDAVSQTLNTLAGFDEGKKSTGKNRIPNDHLFPAGVVLSIVPVEDFGQLPPFVQPESSRRWHYPGASYWGVGYRYMCRFFGVRVMMQNILLQDFDYFLRLDTDSHILERPKTTVLVPTQYNENNNGNKRNKWSFFSASSSSPDQNQQENPENNFLDQAKKWIEISHGFDEQEHQQEQNKHHDNEDKDAASSNSLLSVLGFEEKIVDIDLFLDMAASDAKYSFSMLHPQTLPQFLTGLWEMYDDFYKKELAEEVEHPPELRALRLSCDEVPFHRSADFEISDLRIRASSLLGNDEKNQNNNNQGSGNEDGNKNSDNKQQLIDKKSQGAAAAAANDAKLKNVAAADRHLSKKFGQNVFSGPAPFCTSRGLGLHFWDNFEITNVEMFQEIKISSSNNGDNNNNALDEAEGAAEGNNDDERNIHASNHKPDDSREARQKRLKREQKLRTKLTKRKRSIMITENDFDSKITFDPTMLPPSLLTIRNKIVEILATKTTNSNKKNKKNSHNKKKTEGDENNSSSSSSNDGNNKNNKADDKPTTTNSHSSLLTQVDERRAERFALRHHNARAGGLKRFLNHVDTAGGFFYYRWGDAEVRTLTATLFLQSTEITYANSLPYQHYHNYHCPLPEGPMKLPGGAIERRESISSVISEKTKAIKNIGNNLEVLSSQRKADQIEKATSSAVAVQLQKKIKDMLLYLQLLGFHVSGASTTGDDDEDFKLIDQVLHPSVPSSGYFSAKGLSVISYFVSETRKHLIQGIQQSCESNANNAGKAGSGFATKGRGSAKMLPAEHEHNNAGFWNFAAQQRDGFLVI